MRRILAIGGGGFQMEGARSPIDDYIVRLIDRTTPRICLLATPSGDRNDCIDAFHASFSARGCQPSHVAFFEREPQPGAVTLSTARAHLLKQDAIFVSGGNTRAALALWREWTLDTALFEALNAGTLLAGMSAGAMCWFDAALTDTYWEPGYLPLAGLGFLPGGCRVHYSNHPEEQRERLHDALRLGVVPTTIAIDDHAAVLFEDGDVRTVVAWSAGATAYRVAQVNGQIEATPYKAETLAVRP